MRNKIFSGLLAIVFLAATFSSCEKEDIGTPPEIPPYESMAIDFDNLSNTTKTANAETLTQINYNSAAITVGVWNIIIGVTLIVPVATFYKAHLNEPTYIGDGKWQWSYTNIVLGASYTARLTGQFQTENIKWEMYISRAGINGYDEFKWFEGTSDLDGNGGQWVLKYSAEVQENILQIDWKKVDDEVGDIKYTYIRESSNGEDKQLSKNSYIQYGLAETDLDAFYNVHSTTRDIESEGFSDVNIEWSTSLYNGRIKSLKYFQDSDWHCWDNDGYDIECP